MNEVAHELAYISHVPALGQQPAFEVLEIAVPAGEGHTVIMSHMQGVSFLSVFHPTPELLAALHAATAQACKDGDCPCFKAGEESEKEAP